MRPDRVLILTAIVALLSGCHLFGKSKSDCQSSQEYQRARQMPPLMVPAGLDSPNTQGSLAIPTVAVAPAPPGSKDTCLDVPPRYRSAPPNKAASDAAAAAPAAPAPAAPIGDAASGGP